MSTTQQQKTSTSNLKSHLQWLQKTSYTEQSPRFEYGFDMRDHFVGKPIQFEKYGQNITSTPPKVLREKISRNASAGALTPNLPPRRKIGKNENGIERYAVRGGNLNTSSSFQSSTNNGGSTTTTTRNTSSLPFSLPPQTKSSTTQSAAGKGPRLQIKRKRDASNTSVSTIDLTSDNQDRNSAPPRKIHKDFTSDNVSRQHDSNAMEDDAGDLAAEIDDLMGDAGAPPPPPRSTSHSTSKKKLILPSQSRSASTTASSFRSNTTMPPPPVQNRSISHSNNGSSSSTTTTLPNGGGNTTRSNLPTRSSTNSSSLDTTLAISHLEKEANLHQESFTHIANTVDKLRKIAISIPDAKGLYDELVSVRNQLEDKIFEIGVSRTKVIQNMKEADSGPLTSSDSSGSFTSSSSAAAPITTTSSNYRIEEYAPPPSNDTSFSSAGAGSVNYSNHNGGNDDSFSSYNHDNQSSFSDNNQSATGFNESYQSSSFGNNNDNHFQSGNNYNDNFQSNDNQFQSGNNYNDNFQSNDNFNYGSNNMGDDHYSTGGDYSASSTGGGGNSLNFSTFNPQPQQFRGDINPKIYKERSFSWSEQIEKQLKNKFAIRSGFRSLQLDAINATMDGRDVFVVMPTGGGKSLCYQLPASLSNGVTVVVSPLLSLIQDQLQEMQQLGVNTICISADSEWDDQINIYRDLESPNPTHKLLYVTPEKISQSNTFQGVLIRMANNGTLDRFVIDEAHCISKWGNFFRQDYRQLSQLKEKFPNVPLLALTATATDQVQDDIIQQLRITNCVQLKSSFNRENLVYSVEKKTAGVVEDIVDFVSRNRLKNSSGIVYCLSKKDCENVAQQLNENGLGAAVYHADHMNKKENHENWKRGEVNIICATIAFGMGINKPDVRFVIHHSMPKTIEDYYQESGRAGRDGKKSYCLLFYGKRDVNRLVRLVAGSGMEQNCYDFQKVDYAGLNAMVNYCLCSCVCRRTILLNHFGEEFDSKNCKGKCDICSRNITRMDKDVTDTAKTLLNIVKEMRNCTETNLVKYARGLSMGKSKFRESAKLKELKGTCKSQSKTTLSEVIRVLVLQRYLSQMGRASKSGHIYELLELGPEADKVLQRGQSFTIPVPNESESRKRRTVTLFRQKAAPEVSKEEKLEKERCEALSNRLYILRTKLSHKHGLAPYVISGSTSLDELSQKKPKTIAELQEVTLFTKEKIRNYGIDILREIRQFCSETYHDCTPLQDSEIPALQREIDALFESEEPTVNPVGSRHSLGGGGRNSFHHNVNGSTTKPTPNRNYGNAAVSGGADEDGVDDDDLLMFLENHGL